VTAMLFKKGYSDAKSKVNQPVLPKAMLERSKSLDKKPEAKSKNARAVPNREMPNYLPAM
jgi:hypothetical protein